MNSEASTETLALTERALEVIPSTRSSCVFTWCSVVWALSSSGALPSWALRMAIVASSSVRPSLSSGTANSNTRSTKAPAAISAAT